MRSSPVSVTFDFPNETPQTPVDKAVRALVDLIGSNEATEVLDSNDGNPSDVILVDTEIAGSRYLLIRMQKPSVSRTRLSPREQEIVRMVAKGHPNKVIADVLSISSWTVCTHLRRIFAKLGVGSRAAMVAQLPELGVLTSERHGTAHSSAHRHDHRRSSAA
ncbi:MAG: LuxR C-terminal-related transcriptional regulator [Terracidiphilus sp.]|jgi:DNA-binding CsgD family transcriptional regulator